MLTSEVMVTDLNCRGNVMKSDVGAFILLSVFALLTGGLIYGFRVWLPRRVGQMLNSLVPVIRGVREGLGVSGQYGDLPVVGHLWYPRKTSGGNSPFPWWTTQIASPYAIGAWSVTLQAMGPLGSVGVGTKELVVLSSDEATKQWIAASAILPYLNQVPVFREQKGYLQCQDGWLSLSVQGTVPTPTDFEYALQVLQGVHAHLQALWGLSTTN